VLAGDVARPSPATVAVLRRLAAIYGLEATERQLGAVVGFVTADAAAAVRAALSAHCQAMRHDALAVVEGWDFSDFMLNSSIGNADGDVYGHYLRRVRAQTGEVAGTPSYWAATIGAVLAEGRQTA
jgi:acyl-CoA oxidase